MGSLKTQRDFCTSLLGKLDAYLSCRGVSPALFSNELESKEKSYQGDIGGIIPDDLQISTTLIVILMDLLQLQKLIKTWSNQ